jgi:hypothetical protein
MTTTRWPCIAVAVLGCLLTLVGLRRVRVGAVGLSARRQAASGVHKPHERGVHRHAEREGRESAAPSGGIRVLPRHHRSAWANGEVTDACRHLRPLIDWRILLALLTLGTSASAEGAWVLWQRDDSFDARVHSFIADRGLRDLHDIGRAHHRDRRA